MGAFKNLLRDSIAALRGVGFGHRFAVSHWLRQYEPTPKLRFRSSPTLYGMSRSLRSARLALEPLATILKAP